MIGSLEPLLQEAAESGLSVVVLRYDVEARPDPLAAIGVGDRALVRALRSQLSPGISLSAGSMSNDGRIRAWALLDDEELHPFETVSVVGDDLEFWFAQGNFVETPAFAASHAQAFGARTTACFQRLSFGVVGCSGTGGPLIEMLTRLGAGELVLIDDDRVEVRNLNRIPNTTMADARAKRLKVHAIKDAIHRTGLGTRVVAIPQNLWSAEAVRAVAQCDVLFGCVDSIDGRYLLNTLATHYTLPYFDLGVRIDAVPNASGAARVREVCGSVHYLQPGRSSLMSRGVFSMEQVAAAGLRRRDPSAYMQQLKDGYIAGAQEDSPAVISLNTYIATLAVNEFLSRIHRFREEESRTFGQVEASLASMEIFAEPEDGVCSLLFGDVGRGDRLPLLGQSDISK